MDSVQETLQLCDIVTKIARKTVVKRFIESKAAIIFHLKCFLSDHLKSVSDEDRALWSSHPPAGQRRAGLSRHSPPLALLFFFFFFTASDTLERTANLS